VLLEVMTALWLRIEVFCNVTLRLSVRCIWRFECSICFRLQGQAVQEEDRLASFHGWRTQRTQRRYVTSQKIRILRSYSHVCWFNNILAFI